MSKSVAAFSLLELMVVLAIVAFLSMLAMPSFTRFFAKAKRTEAYTQLRSLYMAEKIYFAEKGTYTENLAGNDGLGWKAEGELHYTYGFGHGVEGKNYRTGSLKTPASGMTKTLANSSGFKIGAIADIDGDGSADYLTIDHNGNIVIVVDDLEN
jgi:prepilin-type N-terminal cleavage/methylation domain-containing protein